MPRFKDFNGRGDVTTHPTMALPGSLEKIDVLTRRVQNKQRLWHPDDAKMPVVQPDEQLLTNGDILFGMIQGADWLHKQYLTRLAERDV